VLALLLIGLVMLAGRVMDLAWGDVVEAGEVAAYYETTAGPPVSSDSGTVADLLDVVHAPSGVFDTVLKFEGALFNRFTEATIRFDFGVAALLNGEIKPDSSVDALVGMCVLVPGWLAIEHTLFFIVFVLGKLLLVALFGGAIGRLAALEACRDQRGSVLDGLRFARDRYPWLVVAPLMPVAVAGALALLMALGGAVLFNVPVLDIIGGLLFGLFLLGGFVIALLLLGLVVGGHLLFPSIAIEGTDAFDAVSRVYNYVLGRPWRWLAYTLVTLVFGAITYLLLSLVVFATLAITQGLAGLLVSGLLTSGEGFDAILGSPSFDNLTPTRTGENLPITTLGAAWFIQLWVMLLAALLPVYTISYYFSAHTWIYLLLRRAADGTAFEDLYLQSEEPWPESEEEPTGGSETSSSV